MTFCQVTAIINRSVLSKVESALRAAGVNGISVTKVKGYGEYADFFERDWMTPHLRIDIYASRDRAEALARTIIDAAHTGLVGDGIIAIAPVESVYRIRTRAQVAVLNQ